jgi:hypothetical protein
VRQVTTNRTLCVGAVTGKTRAAIFPAPAHAGPSCFTTRRWSNACSIFVRHFPRGRRHASRAVRPLARRASSQFRHPLRDVRSAPRARPGRSRSPPGTSFGDQCGGRRRRGGTALLGAQSTGRPGDLARSPRRVASARRQLAGPGRLHRRRPTRAGAGRGVAARRPARTSLRQAWLATAGDGYGLGADDHPSRTEHR